MAINLSEIVKKLIADLDLNEYEHAEFARVYSLARKSPECLSERQREVLIGIASGKTAKEMATELNLATATVEVFKYKLYKRLDLHNVAQVTRYAIAHRLIELKIEEEGEALIE